MPAKHVVFVIDRSGSMVDTFQRVCREILTDVSFMTEDRDFHVILFSDGPAIENRPRRLVPPTTQQKLALVGFLEGVRASGQTDPLPALRRAFQVLRRLKGNSKLIHLLTDGVFPDNEKVLAVIREMNADKKIPINTYLYGHRPPVAEAVMKKIAFENSGGYNYIRPDE